MGEPNPNFSDPLLDDITVSGLRGGWVYVVDAAPTLGVFGPFAKFSELMDHAEKELER